MAVESSGELKKNALGNDHSSALVLPVQAPAYDDGIGNELVTTRSEIARRGLETSANGVFDPNFRCVPVYRARRTGHGTAAVKRITLVARMSSRYLLEEHYHSVGSDFCHRP